MNLEDAPINQTYVTRANDLDSAGKDSTEASYRLTPRIITRMFEVMVNVRIWAKEMDVIKKHVFYGKAFEPDTTLKSNTTGTLVSTSRPLARIVNHETIRVFHAISGLVDETGELVEMFFAFMFQDQEFDWDNLSEECGDILWYMALLAKASGHTTFDEFMMGNMAKLEARYGTSWNQEGALNRDTKAEMQAMIEATGRPGHGPLHPDVASQLEEGTIKTICTLESDLPASPASSSDTDSVSDPLET